MADTTKRETVNPKTCECLFCDAPLERGRTIFGVFKGSVLKHKFCDVHCQLDMSVRNSNRQTESEVK